MSISVVVVVVVFTLSYSSFGAIISSKESDFSARLIDHTWAQCFVENEIFNCFHNKISETLDKAIANNETWQLSDFLAIERNKREPNEHLSNKTNYDKVINSKQQSAEQDHLANTLARKMLQLAQTRSLRLQLPPTAVGKLIDERAINSALDDFNADEGSAAPSTEQEEGRKRRKHKDKNMAMLGGMAMLAMVAQMFLGKVILIAGAAFIMAKVALLISALGSLKNGANGSAPVNDHVIVTRGGVTASHSHEHISDWHRRSPYEHNKFEVASPIGTLTNRSQKLL